MMNIEPDAIYPVAEAAKMLDVTVRTMRRHARRLKKPKATYFKGSEILTIMGLSR